jgi:DNA polymerase-1
MRSLLLIDSYAQIFRGYYAVRVLTSHDGVPTNAVFAMAKFLLKLHADYPADSFDGAFVFDLGKPAHRLELAPDYKANRPPAPPDLTEQIPVIRDLIRAFGWPLFEQQAWEADDLISALANAFSGREIRIISADKDLAQLVNGRVAMLVPSRSGTGFELRDEAAVMEKFGVPPSGIIDYLALVGDNADNIPGIEGIGPKTAARLISDCGSIDAILANPAAVAGDNLRAKLVDGAERLRKNQALVRLLREPPPGANWSDAMLERTAPDFRRIREIAAKLDLNSILRDLDRIAPETAGGDFADDSDDLFAASGPSSAKPEPAAEKAPEKPASDQMEFDF